MWGRAWDKKVSGGQVPPVSQKGRCQSHSGSIAKIGRRVGSRGKGTVVSHTYTNMQTRTSHFNNMSLFRPPEVSYG